MIYVKSFLRKLFPKYSWRREQGLKVVKEWALPIFLGIVLGVISLAIYYFCSIQIKKNAIQKETDSILNYRVDVLELPGLTAIIDTAEAEKMQVATKNPQPNKLIMEMVKKETQDNDIPTTVDKITIISKNVEKEVLIKEPDIDEILRLGSHIPLSDEEGATPYERLKNHAVKFLNTADESWKVVPTVEELIETYFVVFAEAGTEGMAGQTLVANVSINRVATWGKTFHKVYTQSGQFSPVRNGVATIPDGKGGRLEVTASMITDKLVTAVDAAFKKDFSEQLLREVAEEKDLGEEYWRGGALYFYAPKAISEKAKENRENIICEFSYKGHVFYHLWTKK